MMDIFDGESLSYEAVNRIWISYDDQYRSQEHTRPALLF